ncbi:MAG: 1-acyl-sn-glycerol-3-phosphate acyltransferase [Candidatus Izemoplasmatales bacterium]
MTFKERILHQLLAAYYRPRYRFQYRFTDFDPKRQDPYILVGNHTCLLDGQFHSMPLDKYPYPVINSFVFSNGFMNFVLRKLITSIPKRKGQMDVTTIRAIMETLKNGRGVMIFPEGNSSYFGKESPIMPGTAKFLKKMKKDVVFCKTQGGYLSRPRWSDKGIPNGLFDVHYYTLFTSDQLETMTVEEIDVRLAEEMRFNDFDWNREQRHRYVGKHRAVGVERFVYVCPKCGGWQTLSGRGSAIHCAKCGEIARFNEYSLIEGLPFDNLVDWDRLQKTKLPEIVKTQLRSSGEMYDVDTATYRKKSLGRMSVSLWNNILRIWNKRRRYDIPLAEIAGLVLTRKDELSFDVGEKTYFFKFKDPMLFLDAINLLKGAA